LTSLLPATAVLGVMALLALAAPSTEGQAAGAPPVWSFDATIIEACTCQMFCPCYFSTTPSPAHAEHGEKHFCKFNMGYKVNKGKFGKTRLDGAKFWIAGDLGDDFGDGKTEWAEITFDPAVTKEQREAITVIIPKVYPVEWAAFTMGKDAPIEWTASTNKAVAKLDGGKAGEIVLLHNPTAMTPQPSVLENVKYFAAPRNDGFVLMPNEVQAYRVGPHAFESKGTNGFMITYDVSSKDAS
jgi:hypothetical protein